MQACKWSKTVHPHKFVSIPLEQVEAFAGSNGVVAHLEAKAADETNGTIEEEQPEGDEAAEEPEGEDGGDDEGEESGFELVEDVRARPSRWSNGDPALVAVRSCPCAGGGFTTRC